MLDWNAELGTYHEKISDSVPRKQITLSCYQKIRIDD